MKKELRFEEVPEWWAICFNSDCPLSDQCLRHRAGSVAPTDLTKHLCVTPGACSADGHCPHFETDGTIRLASGFGNIFSRVGTDDMRRLRPQVMAYLGSPRSKGTYYRYAHGERLLTPRQQEWIRNLLRRNGYSGDGEFGQYIDDFCFKAKGHH